MPQNTKGRALTTEETKRDTSQMEPRNQPGRVTGEEHPKHQKQKTGSKNSSNTSREQSVAKGKASHKP